MVNILNDSDISDYIIVTFMYECLYDNIPDSGTSFKEMLMYIIIMMQMIYMHDMDDLILESSVSK